MNIIYVITKSAKENFSDLTIRSIKDNLKENDCLLQTTIDDETQLYYKLETEAKELFAKCDYVVIVPNNSYLEPNFRTIAAEYVEGDKTVYLPFSLLIAENNTKGLLNTSMWTSHALEVGLLDHELALMQADTILFGAIIPKSILFDKENYNEDLKYFQHYHFINNVTSKTELEVVGIPKLLINLDYDLTFNHVSKEEKTANYKLAREKFVKQL